MTQEKLILVIDNREANLALLNQVLRRFGYDVVLAAGGREALEQARTHHPDLVILDLAMPGEEGYDTARRLHRDPATGAIPVVAITSAVERVQPGSAELDFRAVIEKPFRLSTLIETVAGALSSPAGEGPLAAPELD